MTEVVKPGSPLWWLGRLEGGLYARQDEMQRMDAYYRGDHPLPFLTRAHAEKIRNEFRQMLEDSRSNFMRLVVDVVEERLRVEGFRLSARSAEPDDEASWLIWQRNQMDAESQTAFVEALVKGVAYVSVWGDGESASIAVEDPCQTIVGYEPGSNFRRRAAALKVWRDDWTGMDRANVYMPDGIYKFEARSDRDAPVGAPTRWSHETEAPKAAAPDVAARRWKELDRSFVANPLGVVPVVALRNRPRLLVEGESELSDVFRRQNQINAFLFLLALAGYFGAHRQRWVTGIKFEAGDNGELKEPFDVAIDRLLATEDPAAKFGDFAQTDLSGYIRAIEQQVQHVAVTTRTPRHLLLPEGQEPSGDSIRSAESGLTNKVRRKQRPFGEGLEEAVRLARRFAGAGDAPADSEIVWADPEIRSEAEVTDAAIKRWQAGLVPWQQTMRDLGYSQTAIAAMLDAFGGSPPAAPSKSAPEGPVAA